MMLIYIGFINIASVHYSYSNYKAIYPISRKYSSAEKFAILATLGS